MFQFDDKEGKTLKLWIDAGHGNGGDPGAVGRLGTKESDVTLAISLAAADELLGRGYEISLTRTGETGYPQAAGANLIRIVNLVNAEKPDYFISIHANDSADHAAEGTEIFISGRGGRSEGLAKSVLSAVTAAVGTRERGVKTDNDALGYNLYVLEHVDMPAVLIETAFLSNLREEFMLTSPLFQKEIGKAIAKGADDYIKSLGENDAAAKSKYEYKDGIHFVHIPVDNFRILAWDKPKKTTVIKNYFNLGFFGLLADGSTIAGGNLCIGGKIIVDALTAPARSSLYPKTLSTLIVANGRAQIRRTDSLQGIEGLTYAVSGVPIMEEGRDVSFQKDVLPQGYDGSETLPTWHGFLSAADDTIVYAAFETKTANCVVSSEAYNKLKKYGFADVIMLDGGGSFVLDYNGKNVAVTAENRRINNVGLY